MTFRYIFWRVVALVFACIIQVKAVDTSCIEQEISSLNFPPKSISCVEFKYHCTHDIVSRDNVGAAYLQINRFNPKKKDFVLQTATRFGKKSGYYSAWRQGSTYDLRIFEDLSCSPCIEFTTDPITVTLGHLNRPSLSVIRNFISSGKIPFEYHKTEGYPHFYNLPSSYFFYENGQPKNGVILFYIDGNDLGKRPSVHYFNHEQDMKNYISLEELKNKRKKRRFNVENEESPEKKR